MGIFTRPDPTVIHVPAAINTAEVAGQQAADSHNEKLGSWQTAVVTTTGTQERRGLEVGGFASQITERKKTEPDRGEVFFQLFYAPLRANKNKSQMAAKETFPQTSV